MPTEFFIYPFLLMGWRTLWRGGIQKNSLFSVRSAYHGEWNHQFRSKEIHVSPPEQSSINKVWDELRKSTVSAKVNFFASKTLHGILPCYGVLANRYIPVSSQCPCCQIHCEDIKHILFEFGEAQEVWKKLGIFDKIENAMTIDRAGSAVLEELIIWYHSDEVLRDLVLTFTWYIWWVDEASVCSQGENTYGNSNYSYNLQTLEERW
jgi:hypothetical protein